MEKRSLTRVRTMLLNEIPRLNDRDRLVDELINMAPSAGQPVTMYIQLLSRELREEILRYTTGYRLF